MVEICAYNLGIFMHYYIINCGTNLDGRPILRATDIYTLCRLDINGVQTFFFWVVVEGRWVPPCAFLLDFLHPVLGG